MAYAAGKKHYGGGRHAPNVGRNGNPAGYIQRTANNKAKQRKEILRKRLLALRGK